MTIQQNDNLKWAVDHVQAYGGVIRLCFEGHGFATVSCSRNGILVDFD